MKTKSKNVRARNWTFITYPESAPSDWVNVLDSQHVRFCVSPLHDKDVTEDGELKKAHYHVVISFTNLKNFEQVKELAKSVNGTKPEVVREISAMVRYLVHLDHPEKYQYNVVDVKTYGGFDALKYLQDVSKHRRSILLEIEKYITEHHVYHLADIHEYAMANEPLWYEFMTSNFMVHSMIRDFIKSIWQRDYMRKDLLSGPE